MGKFNERLKERGKSSLPADEAGLFSKRFVQRKCIQIIITGSRFQGKDGKAFTKRKAEELL